MMTNASTKPRFTLVNGAPMPTDKLSAAQLKFGRPFAHRKNTNFLRQAEPVLNRWARRADYFNLSPDQVRPDKCSIHFNTRK